MTKDEEQKEKNEKLELEQLEKEIAKLDNESGGPMTLNEISEAEESKGQFHGMIELSEISAHQPIKLPGKAFTPRNRIKNDLPTNSEFAQYKDLELYAGERFAVIHDPTKKDGEEKTVLIPYANIRYVVPAE